MSEQPQGQSQTLSQEEKDQRRKLHETHRAQAWEAIEKSTDSFDKSLLTVSSAALGFSITYLKDFVRGNSTVPVHAASPDLLYVTWISLGLCVVLTIFSFRLSAAAHEAQLDYLQKYYEECDESYFNKKSGYHKTLIVFNWVAAALFLLGLLFMMLFLFANRSVL